MPHRASRTTQIKNQAITISFLNDLDTSFPALARKMGAQVFG